MIRAARLAVVRDLREQLRRQEGDELHRSLRWMLAVELPLLARPFIGQEVLDLELSERWEPSGLACSWHLRSVALPHDAAGARGQLRFADDGLHVHGEVQVGADSLPPLLRGTRPTVEQALVRAVARGFGELAATLH